MYPDDPDVLKVQKAFFDPFEYLFLRHKEGEFNTEFANALGDISYQVACHLRVQNIGIKTRDILNLVPDTNVNAIERCSGHDGTYAVKKETRAKSTRRHREINIRALGDYRSQKKARASFCKRQLDVSHERL